MRVLVTGANGHIGAWVVKAAVKRGWKVVGRGEKKALEAGSDAAASLAAIEDVGRGHLSYDGTRGRKTLGLTYRPGREVVTDTVRWLLAVGALKPKVAAKARAKLGVRAAPDLDWAARV